MRIKEMFPYLNVRDAARAIDFYTRAFGVKEKFRLVEPTGRIGHAELDFGEGMTLMLADEFPELGFHSPQSIGGTSFTVHLHVDDADGMIRRAAEAGATVERKPEDQFHGERSGIVRDPFGHRWNIGHSIEEVSPEEMQRRYTKLLETA